MAKNTVIGEVNELDLLKGKVAELQVKNQELEERNKRASGGMLEDIRRQSQKNRKQTGAIPYKEFKDYNTMTMYHSNGVNIGKVVGPLHPDNAESTYRRFAEKGIILSVNKPTAVEVEKYQSTKEFQDLEVKEKRRRSMRMRSKKEGEIEKLNKNLEKLTGEKVVNAIKKQEDVK